jgi:hypothetical protein
MTEGDFCRASARSAPKSVSPEMTILCSSRATSRRTSSSARSSPRSRVWTASCLLRGAVEQVAASGSGRQRSAVGLLSTTSVARQRGRNVVEFKWRKLGGDLIGSHAVSDHPDNGGHGNAQPADARHATHLARFTRDAIRPAIVSLCSEASTRLRGAAMVDRYTEWADCTDGADEQTDRADEQTDRRPRQRAERTRRRVLFTFAKVRVAGSNPRRPLHLKALVRGGAVAVGWLQVAHHAHRIAHQLWAASVNPNESPRRWSFAVPSSHSSAAAKNPTGEHHKHHNQA